MANGTGNQRGGGSAHMNAMRRAAAAAKLATPVGPQTTPLPAPVKRHAVTASVVLQPVESRMARAAGTQ